MPLEFAALWPSLDFGWMNFCAVPAALRPLHFDHIHMPVHYAPLLVPSGYELSRWGHDRVTLELSQKCYLAVIGHSSYDRLVKPAVLFICIHNSARSQMAEAWLNHLCGDCFRAESAGLEPGTLNPLVVTAMEEAGIDISHKTTQAVFDVFKSGRLFAYVITVCDESSAERCPIFAGPSRRLHWSFPDPSEAAGSPDQKLEQVRHIRDDIRARITKWCAEVCPLETPRL